MKNAVGNAMDQTNGNSTGNTTSSTRQNVMRLHQNNVGEKIWIYLKDIESNNTRVSYEHNYRQFFGYMCGKDLHQLTLEDLQFKRDDVMQYRVFLKESYGNSSVNQKIASLKGLYVYLSGIGLNVNVDAFNLKKLSELESKSYGVLHWDEVLEMINRVKGQRKGIEKSLLIELAAKTSFRLKALLGLEWKNFERVNGVYRIKMIDKGKMNTSSVEAEFYERLKEGLSGKRTGRLFELNVKTCSKMIRDLCLEMRIEKERNVVFHSLKKAGIKEVREATNGDIAAITKQGNHSFYTSCKNYSEQNDDPSGHPSLLVGKEINLGVLEGLSKKELLEVIKGCDKLTKLNVLRSVEKILE